MATDGSFRETFRHTLLPDTFSRDQFFASVKQNQFGQAGVFYFLEKPRPTTELTNSINTLFVKT